ncbi:energy-coupling factor transport system ATP-binding protein [Streptomyces sp. DconLS]|nr:energy-coupling factor transport system ATP-binding protein [Streptomyces sp. DconLS]
MIRFEKVSVTYDGAPEPTVRDVDFEVPEGELALLVGPSGVGKSTVLGAVNGLVPHFTGGTLGGRVTVAGRDTRTHKPRELADVVGTVGQDPLAHFVTDTVEDELAYGMESLGLAPEVMRRRVEETLDLLGLAGLRGRPIATLSGGQRQRVAIGSVLTPHPQVLVLDEPTSALDPAAAEEVLAVLQRLVHDLGTTVLMAEHRLERVIHYADRVILLPTPGAPPVTGTPSEIMSVSPVHPPVVALGRLANWSPLPLTVRDARRKAGDLRERLADAAPAAPAGPRRRGQASHPGPQQPRAPVRTPYQEHRNPTAPPRRRPPPHRPPRPPHRPPPHRPHRHPRRDHRPHGPQRRRQIHPPQHLRRPPRTHHRHGDRRRPDPHRTPPRDLIRHVGLVPQEPRDLLYADTVATECAAADQDADADPGTCRALLDRLLPGIADDTHPRDLSEGQCLALALAVVLTARPPLLLLDEPTRGLDYAAKARLVTTLRELAAEGHAIVLATHDVELAAEIAHRVVLLAEGEMIADGPTAEIVVSSPSFAPQVTKILAPQRWLTVSQVQEALG